jgi:hypothetical protein
MRPWIKGEEQEGKWVLVVENGEKGSKVVDNALFGGIKRLIGVIGGN